MLQKTSCNNCCSKWNQRLYNKCYLFIAKCDLLPRVQVNNISVSLLVNLVWFYLKFAQDTSINIFFYILFLFSLFSLNFYCLYRRSILSGFIIVFSYIYNILKQWYIYSSSFCIRIFIDFFPYIVMYFFRGSK